jgi:hypothetical protein
VSGRKKEETALVVAAKPGALTRRWVLGGVLAGAVAAVLGPRVEVRPTPKRWKGKTRWIGHC